MKRARKMVAPAPAKPISDEERLGISATTFLAMCIWRGPNRTRFLLMLVAIGTAWWWLCRRFPVVAWFTLGVLRGLFGR